MSKSSIPQVISLHLELRGLQKYILASQRLAQIGGGEKLIQDTMARLSTEAKRNSALELLGAGGGHLEVRGEAEHLRNFANVIIRELDDSLPGLSASIFLGDEVIEHRSYLAPAPLFLQPCKELGHEPATFTIHGDTPIGFRAHKRLERYRLLDEARTELSDFADKGYIAVVKLDGNSFGSLFDPEDESRSIKYEELRNAAQKAVEAATLEVAMRLSPESPHPARIRRLLQGGDDYLFVMPPRFALPWVVEFAKQRRGMHRELPAVSYAAGVVIASHKLPILRLYELATQLASSAKQLTRTDFAVDWIVSTQSWIEDLVTLRRRNYMRYFRRSSGESETLLLTQRPQFVNDAPDPDSWSLEKLLERASAELLEAFPRSRRRALAIEILRRGRHGGELAFLQQKVPGSLGLKTLFVRKGSSSTYTTPMVDWVEYCEIPLLGATEAPEVVSTTETGDAQTV